MPMQILILFIALLVAPIAACTAQIAEVPDKAEVTEMVGSDRDAHGCIPSAGYLWCERTNRCERPWVLSDEQGFESTQKAFDKYCNDPAE